MYLSLVSLVAAIAIKVTGTLLAGFLLIVPAARSISSNLHNYSMLRLVFRAKFGLNSLVSKLPKPAKNSFWSIGNAVRHCDISCSRIEKLDVEAPTLNTHICMLPLHFLPAAKIHNIMHSGFRKFPPVKMRHKAPPIIKCLKQEMSDLKYSIKR